ncbi:CoA transferase [Caenimonas sedimenti]|uniref:CoA transferase n=1 Tax=Caenimonas sedimenti TaxID=2596921 RepID=A0A562ZT58_9BURK|nr:CoA transferase [Caenimonas sedimenti]TWO71324.1 CoA transferase [Caenimonas sedimenti]
MEGILEGITVVDLSRLIAGPYSTMALADLGARVIKVEARAGEDGRHLGPPFYGESSVTFMSCNRGKESLALDLRKPDGRDILDRLIKRSQVVVHNFRPDFAERHALTYDDVRALQPEVIYAAVTAFGEQAAYRLRPAVDSVVQGMAGGFYASGNEGDDPIRMGIPLVDVACGMCGAFGILAALMHWRQTGRGQQVETVLVDAMFNLMAAKVAEQAVEQREPARAVNLPIAAPSRHFRAGDGQWFSVSVISDGAFARFCDAIGRRHWVTDPRYASNAGRVAHRPEMAAELGAIFATQPATHWLSAFADADIPSGPVNTVSQAMADPHLAARFVAHPALPGLPLIPFPAHLSRGMLSPDQMAPPPRAGQHTAALLHELGCDAAEVQRLVRERVVRLDRPTA